MIALALVVALAFQDTHPFGVEDMLAMDRISDPQVSPDGKSVLFIVRVTDVAANKGRTDVWLAAVDGSSVRALTTHEANDSNARWMPDGRSFAFLSTRTGSSQVWKLSLDGGEAAQLTKLALDVDGFELFPDGKKLLLAMEVHPDVATLEESAARDAEREESKVKARVYDELMFRHWDAWEDGKRSHVFTMDIGGGAPIDLMRGMDVDAPTKPFGGTEEVAISPDGKTVVFAAKDEGRESAWSTNVDLWRAPADGSKAPERITADNEAYDNSPAFSPDGKQLAWLAMARPGYEADRQRIWVMDLASGAKRSLAEAWDRSATELVWSDDGKTLYTTADDVGNHALFAVDVAAGTEKTLMQIQDIEAARTVGVPGGTVKTLVAKGYVASPAQAGDRLLFAHDSLKGPAELYTVALDGSGLRPVTKLNAAKVAAARMGDYEQFSFAGAKGETVYGYLIKPVGFDAGTKYPVAFLIHGGPQGSFGDHFHYRWNAQAYAGAGYAAIMIDFHGSTGYGQAFSDAIRGDWGGAPYEDLMKGLDFALAKYPFLDGTRVAALGASYGGYMINWIAGHTDRFQCLVNHDGNLDERMAYFDTEELWFPEWDHQGTPWENPEHFTRHNPIEHVAKWKTPMLVIHGGNDFRVVDTQGMSTFTALQRRGIPSKFVHFPDENHWVLKPQNSRFWHDQVLGWLEQWLAAAEHKGP